MRPKSLFFAFMLLAGVVMGSMCFYGCDKSSLDKLPTLPDLEDVDDVCSKMTDENFKEYCYDNFDLTHDGKLTMNEANAVNEISCSTAEDFTGIEYFPNLESFTSTSAKYLDLRYNAKLTYIKLSNHYSYVGGVYIPRPVYSAPIEQLDLSYCVNLTTLCSYAFYKCSNLTSIVLPSSLKEIGLEAFYKCSNLTSIELPSNLKEIGSSAFYDCTGLTSIELPSNLKEIKSSAFYDCTGLTSIELPSNLKEIKSSAFYDCTGLTSIELPSSLKEIGASAFYYCTNLKTVTSRASTPPTLDDSVFGYCSSLSTLYVPSKSVKSYKNSDWAIWFTAIEAIN